MERRTYKSERLNNLHDYEILGLRAVCIGVSVAMSTGNADAVKPLAIAASDFFFDLGLYDEDISEIMDEPEQTEFRKSLTNDDDLELIAKLFILNINLASDKELCERVSLDHRRKQENNG